MPNPAPGPKAPAEQFAEVPEGSSTFRDLGLARRREGPLAAAWWAKGQAGRAHRTQLLRTALTRLWDEALETTGVDPGSTAGCAVALGAVGSLGRGQVGPASDLDLVVIYEGREWTDARRQALAKALWYPIWDAGFDLDQSVRSLAECRRIASADLPAASGLLSLRAVAGQRELAERAASAVLADWRGAARRRLEELSADIAAREAAFGHLAFRLEPDLKQARGGLRDLITIDALVASWLADKPHTEIDLARSAAYLWDVREALQQLGRRSAHLAMADQDQVAALMDPYLTADQLLGNLARIGREISYQLDTTLRRARGNLPGRAISPAVFVRGRRQPPRLVPLAKGLAQFGGEIVFAAPQAPVDDAALPLRAGRVAVQTGLSIEPLTLAALGGAPPLPCPWPAEARTELAAWLAGGPALVPAWEALDQAGVVTRLWPEWAAVRNQAQRNPFHRHTVDRHQVEAVALVGSIDLGSARSDLVLTATLFHDLGKRPGQKDHAALGALLAGPLFERMGYRPDESAFMVTLIRHHLLLASLATTLDPSAPETVQRLLEALSASPPRHNGEASAVHRGPAAASETLAAGGVCGGPPAASSTTAALGGEATAAPGAQLLALVDGLAALTEADARAAGPVAWTKLRAELISRLAGAARRALAAGQVG